jgi:hypothetical protein
MLMQKAHHIDEIWICYEGKGIGGQNFETLFSFTVAASTSSEFSTLSSVTDMRLEYIPQLLIWVELR